MSIEKVQEEMMKTMAEINEILAKSMYKAEDDQLPPEQELPAEAPQDAAPAPEAPQEEAQEPQEGQPEHDEAGEIAGHVAEMSDEELDIMLQALMEEKEKRHGQQGQQEEQAPAPEAPAPDMAEKSAKADLLKLNKSLETAVAKIESLSKEVEALKTRKPVVTTKPAMTNRSQVLEKSAKPAAKIQRLTKSETQDFLLNETRNGNRLAGQDAMHAVTVAQTDQELHAVQDALTKAGIKFPAL